MAVTASSPSRHLLAPLAEAGAWVRGLRGWRRPLLAFVAGLISALAFAPLGIFPALLLAMTVLMLLVDGAMAEQRRMRVAALAGWSFGFGQFLAGLYWVGYAFTVDAAAHAWQIPFVATLFPGFLALYPALACAVTAYFKRPDSAARCFMLAGCYALCEWLRGHLFTGFPWNLAAYAWGSVPEIMQSAAAIGAYGLTLLTLLFGASLADFATARRRAWILPTSMTVLFAALWIAGDARLASNPPTAVPGVQLRLVQPNIPQAEKLLPELQPRNWRRLLELSGAPAHAQPTIIVWPEAAPPPFLLQRLPEAVEQVGALIPGNKVLMTGTVRAAFAGSDINYFNSFFIFAHGGKLIGIYDKFHLVPFGEYLPLPGLLHALGLSKIVDMPDGFGEGPGPRTFAIPGAPPVGPLICYEIIFPDAVVGASRPGWIVNVTDDSWFGPSTGPYQHLLTARMRAIEEGLPIARDANTGISAIIDPLGRVMASFPLGRQGNVDGKLPQALPPTLYARMGDTTCILLLLICLLLGFLGPAAVKKSRF
ncbi:MAG TPA: apolipoprotein N-acyltransferase [Rhizomicrobium sp.]|jgi:apolipoprotein N-acyltransferase